MGDALSVPFIVSCCDLLLLRRIATWNNLLRRFFEATSAIEKLESRLSIVEVKGRFLGKQACAIDLYLSYSQS